LSVSTTRVRDDTETSQEARRTPNREDGPIPAYDVAPELYE
jgi:hypothetical protein